MAKPILVIRVPKEVMDNNTSNKIASNVAAQLDNEYHVLISFENIEKLSFETLNDCKGLKDIDIEKLINDLHNGK